jgi:ADP-dependent NAD(P)H-hydrate dehydratase / NAD(P)H-hydrate epimerase
MYLVSAKEMQTMDAMTIEKFGLPGRVLMENAGRGATKIFLNEIYPHHSHARVAVMAGRGNNGGDGFVMARYLAQKEIPICVYLLANRDRVEGDAAANLCLLDPLGIPVKEILNINDFNSLKNELKHQDIWIDAILGTGLSSNVRGFYKEVIDFINASKRPIFSIDIPSGLNSDTGQPCGTTINATATATFAFPKIGHLLYPGVDYTGKLFSIDIGIPPHIANNIDVKQHLLDQGIIKIELVPRKPEAHKGNTGHLLVVAGSVGKTGAAMMAAMAALKSGAGLVTLAAAESLNNILETQVLEAMTFPLPEVFPGRLGESAVKPILDLCQDKDCLALGPGIGTFPETKALVLNLIKEAPIPMVIDADGLNLLSQDTNTLKTTKVPTVLTPHPGEMSRLINIPTRSIQQNRITIARNFAETYGTHLVLKGARTIVAHPDGHVYVNCSGNPGMASAGMGDVLTGIIAGLIVQGYEPGIAARIGTYLHGAAADSLVQKGSPFGFLASQIMNQIPLELGKYLSPQFPGIPIEDSLGYQT